MYLENIKQGQDYTTLEKVITINSAERRGKLEFVKNLLDIGVVS